MTANELRRQSSNIDAPHTGGKTNLQKLRVAGRIDTLRFALTKSDQQPIIGVLYTRTGNSATALGTRGLQTATLDEVAQIEYPCKSALS